MKSWLKYFVLLFCLKFIVGSQSYICDYEYSSEAEGWFRHIVVPATWSQAQLRCAVEGAVLASPTTPAIKAILTEIMNSTETEQQYENYFASFSNGAYHADTDMPLSNIHQTWVLHKPDNTDTTESCQALMENGDLIDLPCEETHPYICYRSESAEVKLNECGTVDPEYHLDKRTNKCYKFHTLAEDFPRAFLACAAEGGHLAIANNDTEAKVLGDLFSQYPESAMEGTIWKDVALIGYHDWNKLRDWRTIHGQTLTEAGYSKFSPGEPNNANAGQHCGGIYANGKLDDIFCNQNYPFICEKSPDYCFLPHEELVLSSSSLSCSYPNLFGVSATFLLLQYFST